MIEIIERHCSGCGELMVIRLIEEYAVGAVFVPDWAGDYWLCLDCDK